MILPFRSGESAKAYKLLWMKEGSPLKVYGYRLTEGVQQLLGDDYSVELAMRYQSPSIDSALKKMMDQRVSKLIVLPLFPQYASASTGSVQEEVMSQLSKYWNIPELKIIENFYDYPAMIDVFAIRGRQYKMEDYDHILFSYHGLPERQITKGDKCDHCFKEGCCNEITDRNQTCYISTLCSDYPAPSSSNSIFRKTVIPFAFSLASAATLGYNLIAWTSFHKWLKKGKRKCSFFALLSSRTVLKLLWKSVTNIKNFSRSTVAKNCNW